MADQATKDILERAGMQDMPGAYDPTVYDPPKNPRRTATHTISLDEEPQVKAKYSKEDDMDVLGYQEAPAFGFAAFKAAKRMFRAFRVPRDRLRILIPITLVLALMFGLRGSAQVVTSLNGVDARITAASPNVPASSTMCSTAGTVGALCTEPVYTVPAGVFLDTNFSCTCTDAGTDTAVPVVQSCAKAVVGNTVTITVKIAALTAVAASTTEIDCALAHD